MSERVTLHDRCETLCEHSSVDVAAAECGVLRCGPVSTRDAGIVVTAPTQHVRNRI